MKAFITGINGFVGNYLRKELERNNIEVFGVDRVGNNGALKCDILNKEELKSILEKIKPDLVFHLAAISVPSRCEEIPEIAMDIAENGTRNVLLCVKELEIDCKTLVISSSYVYEIPEDGVITEETPIKGEDALNAYTRSKLMQEQVCKEFPELHIVISRSFNHIGPGQPLGFIASDFAKQIVDGNKTILVGNIDTKRDYTDVRDVVRAYVLAVMKGGKGEVYNICSGQELTGRKILDAYKELSDNNFEIKIDESKLRKNDILKLIGDYSKFNKDTGWKPEINIKDTLKDVLEYWKSKND